MKKKTDKEILRCNQCGREILQEQGMPREGVFPVRHMWGYFSEKDGLTDSFVLCEACYDKWTAGFAIPLIRTEATEIL